MVGEEWVKHHQNGGYTMVPDHAIRSLEEICDIIKHDNIVGDIVECGVWRGGICIHLSKIFIIKKYFVNQDKDYGFAVMEKK